MLKQVFTASVFSLFLFISTLSVNAASYFTANLNGAQEVPPNSSTATGFGRVTLNDTETQITVSVYYGNPIALNSGVIAGHIHGPAPVGANGPVIFDLSPTTGVTNGSVVNLNFSVTPAQVADLKAGLWYFNIHTSGSPGGEIRGQIFLNSPHIAYLDGNQEVPAVSTSAKGSGIVSVNPATNQALVTVNFAGLSSNATAGHIHFGRSGINGPVVCDLLPPAATSGSVIDRLCNFTPAQITSLKQAQFYFNIHTSSFPGGEIRGQIQRLRSTAVDFDGDGKTDFSIARNNTGANQIEWWIQNSSGGTSIFPFGVSSEYSTTRIAACDYDGDGKDDPSIWRSAAEPNAGFLILQSSNNTVRFEAFGTTGDDPRVIYDYDGDGRCDPAVFRTSNDVWYFLGSANNPSRNITFVPWGTSFANPGDFDGDGRGDFLDQQSGNWWLLRSSDLGVQVVPFGTGSFFGTPGDYDGDGKTDVAGSVNEGSNLTWYYRASSNPGQNIFLTRGQWGPTSNRIRAQGDYDGDGRTDYAVYVTTASIGIGFWYLPSNGNPPVYFPWGISTDFPITGFNNR